METLLHLGGKRLLVIGLHVSFQPLHVFVQAGLGQGTFTLGHVAFTSQTPCFSVPITRQNAVLLEERFQPLQTNHHRRRPRSQE